MKTDQILQRNYDLETGDFERKIRADERKKVLVELPNLSILNMFVVSTASNKPEDLGTPKADPDSDYNRGLADGKNAKAAELRAKLAEMKGGKQ
jgi:hypothetical protein